MWLGNSSWTQRNPVWAFLLVLLAFTATGYLSFEIAEVFGTSSPIWAANGVGIAGLVLGGLRLWPAVLIGRLAAGWLAGNSQPFIAELFVAITMTLSVILPVVMLKALSVSDRLETFRDMLIYLLVAGVLSAALSAALGTMSLGVFGDIVFANEVDIATFWFFGIFSGTLITGPLVQSWWNNWRFDAPLHATALFTLFSVSTLIFLVFQDDLPIRTWHLLPFLIWAAIAFQVRGASMALFLLAFFTLWGIEIGNQPFVARSDDKVHVAVLFQQLIVIAGASALLLAAIDQERRDRGQEDLHLALDAAQLGTFVHNRGSGKLTLDRTARMLFGGDLPEGAIDMARLWARVHPDDRHQLDPFLQRYGSASVDGEEATTLRIFDAVGEMRWLSINGRPENRTTSMRAENTIRGTVQDVTAEKLSKELATNSATFLGNVLDNLFTPVIVLDREGTVLQTNKAPLAIADLVPQDVNGKKFWDCYWWNFSSESQDWLRDACRRVADGETVRRDVEVQAAGGAMLWIDFQMAPLRNEEGEITHLIPSGMDISDRRLTKSENRRLLNMVQHAANFIGMTDADMNLIFLNEGGCRMLGVGRYDTSWMGRHITTLHAEFQADVDYRKILEALERDGLWEGENRLITPEGLLPVTQSISRYVDTDSGAIFHSVIMQDVSDLRDAQERQALLLKELAHRVKNMLAVIQSIARQTIRQTSDPGEFVRSFSGRINSLAISHDQLSEGEWRDLELDALIRQQIEALAGIEDDRVSTSGPSIRLAPESASKMSLATHELATNALKYGALATASGKLDITWRIDDENDRVHVSWVEKGLSDGEEGQTEVPTGFGTTLLQSTYPDMTRNRSGDTFTVEFSLDPRWGRTGANSLH